MIRVQQDSMGSPPRLCCITVVCTESGIKFHTQLRSALIRVAPFAANKAGLSIRIVLATDQAVPPRVPVVAGRFSAVRLLIELMLCINMWLIDLAAAIDSALICKSCPSSSFFSRSFSLGPGIPWHESLHVLLTMHLQRSRSVTA